MKKYRKNVLWAISMAFICILVLGKGAFVSAAETIVPAYVGANDSVANVNTSQYQMPAGTETLSIPIQISKLGTATFEITPVGGVSGINVALSESASHKDPRGWLEFSSVLPSQTVSLQSYAKGACVWYLHFIAKQGAASQNASFGIKAYQRGLAAGITAGSGNLKKGKWAYFCLGQDETGYYKIKAPSSGCLKFEISYKTDHRPEIILLNSKKKRVDEAVENVSYYGLKKGTYYVAVRNSGVSEDIYKMRYTFKNVKITKNTKRSKAASLKKGKTYKGMFLTGGGVSGYWYKLKLTADRTVKINVQSNNDGATGLLMVNPSSGYAKALKLKNGKNSKKLKLKKGVYYLSIDGISGGTYSLQWK